MAGLGTHDDARAGGVCHRRARSVPVGDRLATAVRRAFTTGGLRHGLALLLALAWLPVAVRAQAGGYGLAWSSVSGLSGESTAGLGSQVTGTVGQPVAGGSGDGAGLDLEGGYGAVYGVYPFTVALECGWNLISVPLEPLSPGLDQVMPASVGGPLWEATPTGYQPVLQVVPLHGYWVWSGQAAARVMLGVLVADPYLSVPPGWSLVGAAGGPPYRGLDLPFGSDPSGAVLWLPWGWNGGVDRYQPTVGPLAHGAAYWVYTTVPAVLQLGVR